MVRTQGLGESRAGGRLGLVEGGWLAVCSTGLIVCVEATSSAAKNPGLSGPTGASCAPSGRSRNLTPQRTRTPTGASRDAGLWLLGELLVEPPVERGAAADRGRCC